MVGTGTLVTGGIGAVAGLVGVGMLRQGYLRRRQAARTQNTAAATVADLEPGDGRVSIQGTITDATGSEEAHIADQNGAVVHTEAGRYDERARAKGQDGQAVSVGPEGGSYDYRQEAVRTVTFEVDDGTGTIEVPADAAVDAVVEPDAHIDVQDTGDPAPPIARSADGTDIIIGSQTARLREGVAEVGDEVTVQGVPTADGDGLRLTDGSAPLLVTDGAADEASERQAEGWVGSVLLGVIFLAVAVGVAALLLG